MDYSLLLGIHDCSRAEDDLEGGDGNRSDPHHENSDSEECDSGDRLFKTFLINIKVSK